MAQTLGPPRAVGEELEQFVGREIARERRQPDFETGSSRMSSSRFEPADVTARDTDGGAVQVVTDDPHLARDDRGFERFVRAHRSVEEAGVVGDALATHDRVPATGPP